jgi:hypothetical protein
MMRARGKETAKHVIRPAKVFPLAVLTIDVSKCCSLGINFGRF